MHCNLETETGCYKSCKLGVFTKCHRNTSLTDSGGNGSAFLILQASGRRIQKFRLTCYANSQEGWGGGDRQGGRLQTDPSVDFTQILLSILQYVWNTAHLWKSQSGWKSGRTEKSKGGQSWNKGAEDDRDGEGDREIRKINVIIILILILTIIIIVLIIIKDRVSRWVKSHKQPLWFYLTEKDRKT